MASYDVAWEPHEGLTNTDHGGSLNVVVAQTYTPKGELFPKLSLAVYRTSTYGPEGFRISCSAKIHDKSWWHDAAIPPCLLPDLVRMLGEVVASTDAEEEGNEDA